MWLEQKAVPFLGRIFSVLCIEFQCYLDHTFCSFARFIPLPMLDTVNVVPTRSTCTVAFVSTSIHVWSPCLLDSLPLLCQLMDDLVISGN